MSYDENDGNVTMEALRRELTSLSSRSKSMSARSRTTTAPDAEKMRKILEEFLRLLRINKGTKRTFIAPLKAVDKLNKLDEKTDHGLIETDEREALCAFFDAGAAYVESTLTISPANGEIGERARRRVTPTDFFRRS